MVAYSVIGTKVVIHYGSTFYGYAVSDVQTSLNDTLAEGMKVSDDPEFKAGLEWAYRRMCKKLGLEDEKEVK